MSPPRSRASPEPVPPEYRTTLEALYRRRRFGIRPGLEVVTAVLHELGNPERAFHAIHVTGSKGKGSVAAMAAAILTASGRRTGLFTSPHLRSFRERVQIDRAMIPPDAVVAGMRRVETATARALRSGAIDREPTFFEAVTALAFDWFRVEGVEDAVIEVGIGGRLDSTNVLEAPVGVITAVELEHTDILGPTLTDIAREKAGILHPGMRGVVGALEEEPLREVRRLAGAAGVPLWFVGRDVLVSERTLSPRGQRFTVHSPHLDVEGVELSMFGTVQPGNAALAIAAVDLYARARGFTVPLPALRKGLADVRWPGRCDRVARRPDLFVDVAHTPQSALALAQSIGEIAPFESPEANVVLFGCLADKRVDAILDALEPLAHTIVLVPLRSERSARVEDLRRSAVGRFRRVVVAPEVATGLALARAATLSTGFTVATGSDYLVGEVLNALEGTASDEPDLSDPGRVGASPVDGGDGGRT